MLAIMLLAVGCGGSETATTPTLSSSTHAAGTGDSEQPAPQPSTETTQGGEMDPNFDRSDRVVPKTDSSVAQPPPSSGVIEPSLAPFVAAAIDDLATRLGVEPAGIEVDTAEFVVWSDRSLGCPQPGMAYAQVPTDGSRIVLVHDGDLYTYHTGGTVPVPFLCE